MKHIIKIYHGQNNLRMTFDYEGKYPEVFAKGAIAARVCCQNEQHGVHTSDDAYTYNIETTRVVYVAVDEDGDVGRGDTEEQARVNYKNRHLSDMEVKIVSFEVKE